MSITRPCLLCHYSMQLYREREVDLTPCCNAMVKHNAVRSRPLLTSPVVCSCKQGGCCFRIAFLGPFCRLKCCFYPNHKSFKGLFHPIAPQAASSSSTGIYSWFCYTIEFSAFASWPFCSATISISCQSNFKTPRDVLNESISQLKPSSHRSIFHKLESQCVSTLSSAFILLSGKGPAFN